MQEAIKYISMKLDENERSNTIRLMKVKDMLLKEAIEEKREPTPGPWRPSAAIRRARRRSEFSTVRT